jgi:hypothetical protein
MTFLWKVWGDRCGKTGENGDRAERLFMGAIELGTTIGKRSSS